MFSTGTRRSAIQDSLHDQCTVTEKPMPLWILWVKADNVRKRVLQVLPILYAFLVFVFAEVFIIRSLITNQREQDPNKIYILILMFKTNIVTLQINCIHKSLMKSQKNYINLKSRACPRIIVFLNFFCLK